MITEVSIGGNEQLANAGFVRRLRLLRRADVLLVMDPERYPTPGPWRVLPLDAAFGRDAGVGRQRLPGDAGMDGFFYARLAKA